MIFEQGERKQDASEAELDLLGLIESFNLRQTTGLIELPQIEASIGLLAGQVVSAYYPDCSCKDGVTAFFEIIAREPTRFHLVPQLPPKEHNVHITTPSLFKEAMIWLEEESRSLQSVEVS